MKMIVPLAFASGMLLNMPAIASEGPFAKPDLVLRQIAEGMPNGARQELRVMTATFKPGDKTVDHTHRFPVTVYVLEGEFTLELAGRSPIVLKAGEALIEPPNVAMTGFNRSAAAHTKVIIFYVSDPETPFLDAAH
jgi:quercetin dioxygenase-like cupin family protein